MRNLIIGVCAAAVCAGCGGTKHQQMSSTATTTPQPPQQEQPAVGVAATAGTGSMEMSESSAGTDVCLTTLTGEAMCGKCVAKETAKCQTVIQTRQGDKTVKYYVIENDVSRKFHQNVCKQARPVTAMGTARDNGGTHEFTATVIELEELDEMEEVEY